MPRRRHPRAGLDVSIAPPRAAIAEGRWTIVSINRQSSVDRRQASIAGGGREHNRPAGDRSSDRRLSTHGRNSSQRLLSRHGIVTREALTVEGIPGGFSTVYPVLKAMEESGRLRRGYFVTG